jgi:CHAD domain-containing protein
MGFKWSLDDRSIGDGLRRIARQQAGKAIAIAESTGPPERRVHEARRRSKKLRALLRLVRPDFSSYAEENAYLRDAARRLSAARDVRVAADTLAGLLREAGHVAPPAQAADRDTGEEAGLVAFAAGMREMLERIEKWKAGRVDRNTLAQGLTDTYRRGRRAMRLVADQPSDAAFHEWRKLAKYHWNQLRLLEASAEDILPSAHKAAGRLADMLGQHHDLAVLRDMIGRDAGQFGEIDAAFVRDLAARRQAELEQKISTLGRQVYAETPKALHARFTSYLDGWLAPERGA